MSNTKEGLTILSLGVAGIAAFVGCMATMAFVHGFIISTLWGWFMVPIFGIKGLTVAQSIGVGLVAQAIRPVYPNTDKDNIGSTLFNCLVLTPVMALLMGYIVKGLI